MRCKLITAFLAWMCMLAACACAQTLPGVDVFSPGLVSVSEKLAAGEMLKMDAQMGVTDMLYVRDVSVLDAMFSGATLSYEGSGSMLSGSDRLSIHREGEELFSLGMARDAGAAQITVNGQTYGVESPGEAAGQALDALCGVPLLERVPLDRVCAWIEGLKAGDALAAGFALTRPFAVVRTMSDDGTRLTKIEIEGEIARAGEAAYRVEGYLRQPGGRSPKDTFEITLTQDERNFIELDYSALRKSEITRKNKAGETQVDTTLKAAGKIDGSGFSSRLRVITRNAWTADEENLRERVSISATLGHTDHAPGRRMLRLNDLSAKLRCTLSLESAHGGSDVIRIDEESTLSAVFDGNTFLDIALDGQAQVGGEGVRVQLTDAPIAPADTLAAAFEEAAVRMAQRIYPQLGEKTQEKIGAGL